MSHTMRRRVTATMPMATITPRTIVGGEVIEGNAAIADDPAVINRDPEGEGWFFKLKLSDPSELDGLMDEAAYREWVKTL